MVTKDFPIFDCDSHVVEPPEIWDEYVPSAIRSRVKTQFHFHTDTDVLHINGRVVPATRERSNAAEVGWPRWNKKEVGALVPGTEEWQRKFGRLAGCREPQARLRDMDALGTDQVMLFPTWFVRLALVKAPEAASALARAYNDWVYDYCAANRQRLFPCAVLAIQSVEESIGELRRVAKRGFKAAAIRPEWAERIARTRGSGDGLLFTDEAVVYSPGQFLSNIVFSMEPSIDSSEALGFIFEAMTWLTAVLMTGWLDKFPRLRAAVLESNATWLPLVLSRSRNFLDLYAFQRGPKVRDPYEVFYERCFIAFEGDEEPVYRMWDHYENVGLWSSDYPHHDAEDGWEALELMARHKVPVAVQRKLLGENARRLYGIEPVMVVTERVEQYEPARLPW